MVKVLVVKDPPANAGLARDAVSISGSGRTPGGGKGYPLQNSVQENSMGSLVGPMASQRVGHN